MHYFLIVWAKPEGEEYIAKKVQKGLNNKIIGINISRI